ncbi:MAG: DUF2846 domain-containing protein [SAR324 cluster bacterium]|nr:DUF2846 domain-containing protein [SAR324 cluster bacterium]
MKQSSQQILSYIVGICAILNSCSATGPTFIDAKKSDSFALIYIYRPNVFCGSARKPDISINDNKILELQNNGYTQIYVKPGDIHIKASGIDNTPRLNTSLNINVETYKSYFIRYNVECEIFLFLVEPFAKFQLVEQSINLREISQTHYQPPLIEYVEPAESTK